MKRLFDKVKIFKYLYVIKNSQFFNSEYFSNQVGLNFSSVNDAARHYLESDMLLNPSLNFDSGLYLKLNPDVKALNMNPLLHYELYGKNEGRAKPMPVGYCSTLELTLAEQLELLKSSDLFDSDFYFERNKDVDPNVISSELHFILSGCKEGRDPSPSFSVSCYLENNIDVLNSNVNPLLHYIKQGLAEGRNIYPSKNKQYESLIFKDDLFDNEYYLNKYPDVRDSGVDPQLHYLHSGFKEGRNPSAKFNTAFYLQSNPDVSLSGVNPLSHYLQQGRKEKRRCSPEYIEGYRLTFDPRVKYITQSLPVVGQDYQVTTKVAIHIHCHYVDVFKKILVDFERIFDFCDFYISCTSNKVKDEILNIVETSSLIIQRVIVAENRGRDIAPMLIDFSEELSSYDVALHFHTKKSIEKEDVGSAWLDDLRRKLLFNKHYVKSILSEFSKNPKLGILAPEPFWLIEPFMKWGSNREQAEKLFHKLDLAPSLLEGPLDFPAGSMFWFRPEAIKQVLTYAFEYRDFPNEPIPDDGTLAHAIERCFGYLCKYNGYEYRNIKPKKYELSWPKHIKPKVSIVIPVYNAKDTLIDAIESVLQQDCTHVPFELILVDNGSTDGCLSIQESYERLHANIRCYSEIDKGAGNARNLGLNKSLGEFVMFLDADDVLSCDAISNLYAGMLHDSADLVVSSLSMFDENSFQEPVPYKSNSGLKSLDSFDASYSNELWRQVLSDFGPCAKLYKRQFLLENSIYFPAKLNYEDNLFIYSAYLLAGKVTIIPKVTYFYRKFEKLNGVTQSTNTSIKGLEDQVKVIRLIVNNFVSFDASEREQLIASALLTKLKWLVPLYGSEQIVQVVSREVDVLKLFKLHNLITLLESNEE